MLKKSILRYFWSHFHLSKNEKQLAFVHKNNQWKSYVISENETAFSGELDVKRLAKIAPSFRGGTVYIVHNHPTQTPTPSNPDRFQYAYVQSLLALCDIEIYDYLIMSPYGYFSFREADFLIEDKTYLHSPTKAVAINMPRIILRTYIEKHQKEILTLSETYGEMIFNNHYQYGTEKEFSSNFLLRNEQALCNKHIFFKRKNSESDTIRMNHIDRALDPIDIYWIEDDTFISIKTQCRIHS